MRRSPARPASGIKMLRDFGECVDGEDTFTSKTSVPEWDRQFRLVRVHHEYGEELGRFRLAGIGADAVAVAGQLGEALSGEPSSGVRLTPARSTGRALLDGQVRNDVGASREAASIRASSRPNGRPPHGYFLVKCRKSGSRGHGRSATVRGANMRARLRNRSRPLGRSSLKGR